MTNNQEIMFAHLSFYGACSKILGASSLVLVGLYPLMKRITNWVSNLLAALDVFVCVQECECVWGDVCVIT